MRGALALALAIGLAPGPVVGQWISPGELSQAHAELDGDGSCTRCHVLRERGVQARLCLDCHTPLARRIDAGAGYHGDPAREDCGDCHREHFGRDVAPVRFDTAAFRHEVEAGWPLRGSHGDAGCRACHRSALVRDSALAGFDGHAGFRDRTFLGLPTACGLCHAPDDPHGTQFAGRSCGDCHDEVDWARPVLFSHDRTAYPLTGRHRDVGCEGCHPSEADIVRYAPVRFDACERCHADPHGAAMVGTCEGCHSTAGWTGVSDAALESGFRHAATRFPLVGAHEGLACEACHRAGGRATRDLRIRVRAERGRAYPVPTGTACRACHVDAHHGELDESPGGGACEACHGSDAWLPTTYDVARHNRLAVFPLDGAHAATPCGECHRDETGWLTLGLGSTACRSCHDGDDPHGGRFADRGCDACHGTAGFAVAAFDHGGLSGGCTGCHAEDDPHAGQFQGRECDACHDTDSYAIADFPHRATGFPLDGAHARVACGACHRPEPGPDGAVVRWTGLPTECEECHGGGR